MRTIEKIFRLTAIVNSLSESNKVFFAFKGTVPAAVIVEPRNHDLVELFEKRTLLRRKRQEAEAENYWIKSRRELRQEVFCKILDIESDLVTDYLDCFILTQGWQDDEWIKTLIESRAKFPYKIIEFTDK